MNNTTNKIKYFFWKLTLKVSTFFAKDNAYVKDHLHRDSKVIESMVSEAKETARRAKLVQHERDELARLCAATKIPDTPSDVNDVSRYIAELSGINTSTKFLAELFSKAQSVCTSYKKLQRLDFVMPITIENGRYNESKKWEIAYRTFSQKRWKLLKTVPMQNLESMEAVLEFCSLMDSLGYSSACDPVAAFSSFINDIFKPTISNIKAYSVKHNLTIKSDFIVQFYLGYETDSVFTNPKIEVILTTTDGNSVKPMTLSITFSRPKLVKESVG